MQATTQAVRTGETGGGRPAGGAGFDWAVTVFSGSFVVGAWLDAWAHDNLPSALETFFTPWHAVLYTGFLAAAALLVGAEIRGRARGFSWRRALPDGYGLSLLGVLAFGAGGVGDMVWHLIFGIEVSVEALLSPTHLLLALGAVLVASGPFRAAWRRPASATPGKAPLPALLSLALAVSLLVFFTAYANPFGIPWPDRQFDVSNFDFSGASSVLGSAEEAVSTATEELGRTLGVTSVLLQTALLMGGVLLAARRWELPFGTLTLVFTLVIGLSVLPHAYYLFILVALLAGLAADLLLRALKPSSGHPGALRLFAFAAPVVLYALYFLALALTGGVSWPVELWSGAILLSGAVGLLLSYLAAPEGQRHVG